MGLGILSNWDWYFFIRIGQDAQPAAVNGHGLSHRLDVVFIAETEREAIAQDFLREFDFLF